MSALAGLVVAAAIGLCGIGATRGTGRAQLKAMLLDAEAAHPNALWHVVHDLCLRSETTVGSPAPCARVSLSGRYAVIKDPERRTQLLLVPTDRIVGLESPSLLNPGEPNYWQEAWTARDLFQRQFSQPVPREDVGMAVNSAISRNQAQLHIHIDCVAPPTLEWVDAHLEQIGESWSDQGHPWHGRRYRALWVPGLDLAEADPFKLLARDPEAGHAMAAQSVAVIGARRANGQPGFVVISYRDSANQANADSGEGLLDHHCYVLDQSRAGPRP
jgi:CDP-diacylglycerol pyrophosphatase